MRWILVLLAGLILGVSGAGASQKSTIKEDALKREINKAKHFEKTEKFEKATKVYERLEKD